MQRLEVSGAVRPIYGSLGVKRLNEEYYGKIRIASTGDLIGSREFCNVKEYQPLNCEV